MGVLGELGGSHEWWCSGQTLACDEPAIRFTGALAPAARGMQRESASVSLAKLGVGLRGSAPASSDVVQRTACVQRETSFALCSTKQVCTTFSLALAFLLWLRFLSRPNLELLRRGHLPTFRGPPDHHARRLRLLFVP